MLNVGMDLECFEDLAFGPVVGPIGDENFVVGIGEVAYFYGWNVVGTIIGTIVGIGIGSVVVSVVVGRGGGSG